jgi:hypothetical protein
MKTLLALLLFPLVANAEPGPTSQFLMREPATLLDIGMARLSSLTTAFEQRVGLSWTADGGRSESFRADINADYEAEDDRIYVSFLIMDSEATKPQMKEGCGMAMNQMAIWLTKSLPGLFAHVGDDRSADAAKPFSALQEMFVLRCYVSSARDTSEGRFWASRSLKDPAMTIGPWDVRN